MPLRSSVLRSAALCGALLFAASAHANDLRLTPGAQQVDIRAMTRDLGAGLSYKALGPAAAYGIMGFDIGAFATYADIDESDPWDRATGGQDPSSLWVVGARARKGLPLGLDASIFIADLPSNDGTLFGGSLQYALLEGGPVTPGVALRLGYSSLSGVDDFDFDAWSVDATVSKGFPLLTPYAGAGIVISELDPSVGSLSSERTSFGRVFGGVRLSLGFLDVTPEVEMAGGNFSANLRLGVTMF